MRTFKINGLRLVAGGMLAGALGLGFAGPGTTSGSDNGAYDNSSAPDKTMNKSEPGAATELPPNVAPGWKIRVCSEKTKADKIQFKFTPGDKKEDKMKSAKDKTGGATQPSSSEDFTAWNRGDSTLISVPSDLREVEKLRIEAAPSQKNAKSIICVIYNDHVTKKMSFDDREVSTVKATETGECGC